MKSLAALLVLALVCIQATRGAPNDPAALPPVVFLGMTGTAKAPLFLLVDQVSGRSSGWIAVGTKFGDYVVTKYDAKAELLTLVKDNVSTRIHLIADAKILAAQSRLLNEDAGPTEALKSGTYEATDCSVVRVLTAKDGNGVFRAYIVLWQGQEVVAQDRLVKTDYKEGEMVRVLAMKHAYPNDAQKPDLLSFMVAPAMKEKNNPK